MPWSLLSLAVGVDILENELKLEMTQRTNSERT